MTLAITTAHHAARNAATIALADSGPGYSTLRLYDGASVYLGACALAKPCAEVQPDGTLMLLPNIEPEIAVASGVAVRLEWCDGAGVAIATGTVTELGGGGDFELVGASGTQIYAGAQVLLQAVVIG